MEKKQIQFVSVTPEELKEDLIKLIKKELALALKEFNKNSSLSDDVTFMTRDQTANMLSINLSTLWKFTNQGKLKSYGIPDTNRVYYKKNEVLDSMEQIKIED